MMASICEHIINHCAPSEWDPMLSVESVRVALRPSSQEYMRVERQICASLPLTVHRIERIQNPFLWGSYLLKKAQYRVRGSTPCEMELFHCTAAANVPSIVRDNLDPRRVRRGRFGRGVSFSRSAEYCNWYANHSIGSDRAMLLCKVVVGSAIAGHEGMVRPPPGYDTTTGRNESVFVKYFDNEFYPCYAAYYTFIDDETDDANDDNYDEYYYWYGSYSWWY